MVVFQYCIYKLQNCSEIVELIAGLWQGSIKMNPNDRLYKFSTTPEHAS